MTCQVTQTLVVVIVSLATWSPGAIGQSIEAGRSVYEARCVGCHGSDGAGGGHGPAIVDIRRPRAESKAAMRDLIRNGIPNTAMPAFTIADAELDALVAYVDVLRAPAVDHPAAGDAAAGERFFTGKGNCSSCHMIRGRGGILGPDLSDLARERRTTEIEQALREPGASHAIAVHMRDGRTLRGLTRYESPFDLGVQGLDGTFHSISRSDIARVTAEPPLMPRVQATADEMRDLLAYLTRLTVDRSPRATLARDRRGWRGHTFCRHRSTEGQASGRPITDT